MFRELLELQKWTKTFRCRITPFWGYSKFGVIFTPEKEFFLLPVWS